VSYSEIAFLILGVAVVASPALLLVILGLTTLVGRPLSETVISKLTSASVVLGLVPAVVIFFMMLALDTRYVPIELGDWISIEQEHFHFHLKFVFDRLSVPFTVLSFVLCGVVGTFTRRYLHREAGYNRFFLCYSFFFAGMVISSLAGTIETLFFGWELVGLSSALLIAYFHERENPVRNGARVWSVYRLADAAFLIAAITMHKLTGAGEFGGLMGAGAWPDSIANIDASHAFIVGSLLLVAAAGKSGLVPFSGWLPRAMEGPTPSSAVFYGALSVHLGAYLLLRVSPILDQSMPLRVLVIVVGLVSAIFGTLMSRVQTDVKTSLAYASLTQVGIIVVEIGFGLQYLALIHIIGHACLRTMQLLRAPTLLKDYHNLENAIGARLSHETTLLGRMLPLNLRNWFYRFGYERGYLDTLLDTWFVSPFVQFFRWSDTMERMWTDWISKEPSRESDNIELHPEEAERAA
jgi:NADH:ubiquinone oxidoreductase subunit 5 (subunit L)/multisubunit Na+/H+ antiporter MnhA subunit